jgi:hypothetical protein
LRICCSPGACVCMWGCAGVLGHSFCNKNGPSTTFLAKYTILHTPRRCIHTITTSKRRVHRRCVQTASVSLFSIADYERSRACVFLLAITAYHLHTCTRARDGSRRHCSGDEMCALGWGVGARVLRCGISPLPGRFDSAPASGVESA